MRIEIALIVVLVSATGSAWAYDVPDHEILTAQALAESEISKDARKRMRIGLAKPPTEGNVQVFMDSKRTLRSVEALMQAGAAYEDEGVRSISHFFNPVTNSPLHIDQDPRFPPVWMPTLVSLVNSAAQSSPDWSLNASPLNSTSYWALKNYHYVALTASGSQQRSDAMGMVFETLGHIVHHLQDMAQPQHVRNDLHWETPRGEDCDPSDQSSVMYCDAYRVLSTPSTYERWTKDLQGNLPYSGYSPVYGPSAGGGAPSVPREFWINAGRGIAEYTNRNFVSAGTMLVTPPALAMDYDVSASVLCANASPACEVGDLDHVVTFWKNSVDDQLYPTTTINDFAAAASIFEWDFRKFAPTGQRPYTVNRFTFDAAHRFLLPRAVAYSAGFINYYFRGDMDVTVPDDGVYAVVDTHPQACGAPCGFRTVRLKIRNATPRDDMGAGSVRLVAKYHLNTCYQADLSGEDGGLNFGGNACRTTDEYVAVSDPVDVGGIARSYEEAKSFFFPGTLPIPINASDLNLQVVFRGRLGHEDDAIAVSTVDIGEPNFVAIGNITDYAFDIDGDQRFHALPYKLTTKPVTLSKVTFGFQNPGAGGAPLASLADLAAGEHARFAFLADRGKQSFWLRTQSSEGWTPEDGVPFDVDELFLDETANPAQYVRSCPVSLERGLYQQFFRYFAQVAHHQVSGRAAVIGESGRSASVGLVQKYGSNCYSAPAPGSGGQNDVSYLLPKFGTVNMKQWTFNF